MKMFRIGGKLKPENKAPMCLRVSGSALLCVGSPRQQVRIAGTGQISAELCTQTYLGGPGTEAAPVALEQIHAE